MNTLTINGTDLSTYGIYLGSETYLDAPLIDYTAYDIPAKNGSVIQYNKRLNNVIRRFDCYIPETGNVQTAMDSLKKLLYSNIGYMRLESSYDTGTYQEGYLAQEISVAPFNIGQSASFSLYFSCKPQKWYKTSVNATVGVTISYPQTIVSRTSAFMQSTFNALAGDLMAQDSFFMVFDLGQSISSWSASWSIGNTIMYLVEATSRTEDTVITNVLDFTNTSFSGKTFSTTDRLYLVMPYTCKGTLTYGGSTLDLTKNTATITESSALGFNLNKLIISFNVSRITYASQNPSIITTYLNGELRDTARMIFRDSIRLTDVINAYEISGLLPVIMDYSTMTPMLQKSGLPDFDLSNYVTFEGNLNLGDTVNIQGISKLQTGVDVINSVGIYGSWWKL